MQALEAQRGGSRTEAADQLDKVTTTMRMIANVKTLPHEPSAIAAVETDSQRRCERALDMLLTQRGDASAEVERLLADDPGCVFGHCLRAALIVRAESAASRSALTASIAAIEAACPDAGDPVRRHALAATAIRHMQSHFTGPS